MERIRNSDLARKDKSLGDHASLRLFLKGKAMYEGSAKRIFMKYAVPQMIGLLFNSVYIIVDGVFIGNRLESTALAAACALRQTAAVDLSFAFGDLCNDRVRDPDWKEEKHYRRTDVMVLQSLFVYEFNIEVDWFRVYSNAILNEMIHAAAGIVPGGIHSVRNREAEYETIQ